VKPEKGCPTRVSIQNVELNVRFFPFREVKRECALGSTFGCATPAEAVQSHSIFAAALASQKQGETVSPSWERSF
jgi:hypothetical protein